ncbi:hypothetical protein [Dyella sp. M7H15-1]|uniref:hypothetical protein n=1 Tax=Dyella sp. M7H15-1 TaxID=2501295 RepID=UPI00197AB963|nr:hypothetical protein [Dyella sp. M7H15-1]
MAGSCYCAIARQFIALSRLRRSFPLFFDDGASILMSFDRLIPDILFGFTGLISIINPVGMAFVFLERTRSLTDAERSQLAKKVAANIFLRCLRFSSWVLRC